MANGGCHHQYRRNVAASSAELMYSYQWRKAMASAKAEISWRNREKRLMSIMAISGEKRNENVESANQLWHININISWQ